MANDAKTTSQRNMTNLEPIDLYRPIAPSAVLCFIGGLLSLLAFASPLFWPLPFFVLVYAILTSRRLERARREYAGQFLAKLGLLLALVTGLGAPSQKVTQSLILTRDAMARSDEFVDLVLANHIKEGFQATINPYYRASITNVDELPRRDPKKYRKFIDDEFVFAAAGKGEVTQVTCLGASDLNFAMGMHWVNVHYELDIDGAKFKLTNALSGGESDKGDWAGRQWHIVSSKCVPLGQ